MGVAQGARSRAGKEGQGSGVFTVDEDRPGHISQRGTAEGAKQGLPCCLANLAEGLQALHVQAQAAPYWQPPPAAASVLIGSLNAPSNSRSLLSAFSWGHGATPCTAHCAVLLLWLTKLSGCFDSNPDLGPHPYGCHGHYTMGSSAVARFLQQLQIQSGYVGDMTTVAPNQPHLPQEPDTGPASGPQRCLQMARG